MDFYNKYSYLIYEEEIVYFIRCISDFMYVRLILSSLQPVADKIALILKHRLIVLSPAFTLKLIF